MGIRRHATVLLVLQIDSHLPMLFNSLSLSDCLLRQSVDTARLAVAGYLKDEGGISESVYQNLLRVRLRAVWSATMMQKNWWRIVLGVVSTLHARRVFSMHTRETRTPLPSCFLHSPESHYPSLHYNGLSVWQVVRTTFGLPSSGDR
jgi:hypothetical protein